MPKLTDVVKTEADCPLPVEDPGFSAKPEMDVATWTLCSREIIQASIAIVLNTTKHHEDLINCEQPSGLLITSGLCDCPHIQAFCQREGMLLHERRE